MSCLSREDGTGAGPDGCGSRHHDFIKGRNESFGKLVVKMLEKAVTRGRMPLRVRDAVKSRNEPASELSIPMTDIQPNNPLHGITLEKLLNELVAHYGWPALGERIAIRCFIHDPSISSSLKFLRRTPWARERVEALYIDMLKRGERKRERD